MKDRILVVEDDPEFRQFEKEILEDLGFEVIEASNAKDGLYAAIRERPALILIDIRLPSKKRGIGLAKLLRKAEETRGIPVIFVTGYEEGEYSAEIRNIPNCGFMAKPFDIGTFRAKIKEHIGPASP